MIRKIALGLLVIGVVVVGAIWVGAWLSIDGERQHARRTAELPLLADGPEEGLVRIPARGFEFRARVAGFSNDGPGLVLLHGFPETSIMWDPLLEAASRAGFRVVAFDQRGYSPGARPEPVEAYAMPELVADVIAVADAVGFERFHLMGHDWGAAVGWTVTGEHPDRVLSWASLSIPHPGALIEARGDAGLPAYMRFFRLPGVAETLFTTGGLALLRINPALPPEQLEEHLAVFSEPGAMRAALNWYRAIEWTAEGGIGVREVGQPALWIYGTNELPVFVEPRVRELQPSYVTGAFETVELDGAGHWLIQERPKQVVDALMAHLRAAQG